MKKASNVIVALFLLINAKAQQADFGIKGGINISNLNYNNNTTTNSKPGLNFGVFAHIHASQTWAIQPEVIYSLEGATFSTIPQGVRTNLNYLNVPVLLQYLFYNGFRVEGGPQIGVLLNAKTKTGEVTVNNAGFQSTAVSIPLGAGYQTSSGFGIDARYVFGLSNINDNVKNGPTIQSKVFQLGVFYQPGHTWMRSHHK